MLHVRDMSLYGHKRTRKVMLAGSMSLALFLFGIIGVEVPFLHTPIIEAQQASDAQELHGYAWSDNIGWISFNCADSAVCATSDYKVVLNTDKTLTGYAWSDNIGWIRFGGLSGFPSGAGTQAINAKITGNTLKGWARACAGSSGADCTGLSADTTWDGWISLSGSTYGVALDAQNHFSGYAWGGDIVGWVDWTFDTAGVDPQDPENCQGGAGVCVSELVFSFTLSDVPLVSLDAGDAGKTISVDVNAIGGNEGIDFAVTSPSQGGISLSRTSGSCTNSNNCSFTLDISADSNASDGRYTLNIEAVSSETGATAYELVTISVTSITLPVVCTPDKARIRIGQTATFTANVTRSGSYAYTWTGADAASDATATKQYTTAGTKSDVSVQATDGTRTGTAVCSVGVATIVIEEF